MKKEDLLVRLTIAEGELSDMMCDYDKGCFDEIAQRIFMLALGCEELLDKSSNDVQIQLDRSVMIVRLGLVEYIDSIYLEKDNTEVCFSASSRDGSEIYCYGIEDIYRKHVFAVLQRLIEMCKYKNN